MNRLLALRARVRFALWAARLRAEMRRRGGRLELHGHARFDGPPRLRISDGGTLVLRLGEGVRLGRELQLEVVGGGELDLGDGVYFQHGARVILRGGSIALSRYAQVRDGAWMKSAGRLTVGERVTVGLHNAIGCENRVEIGDRSGLAERVTVSDSDHTHDGSDDHFLYMPLRIGSVRIGDNTLVSAGVVVARDAHVGDNSVIGANAVVLAGEYPPGQVLVGTPARAVKALA